MKKTAVISAPAKLNLYLDILGRRSDGYHNIESIMQGISLCDTITVTAFPDRNTGNISITCTDKDIPVDDRNICCKAAKTFFDYSQIAPCDLEINIEKKIPSQAGMGGGSADAAAVTAGLNRIFGTFYDAEELCNICYNIGADVSACLLGGTQYCTGRGDCVRHLADIPQCCFVIGKGTQGISTSEAYQKADSAGSFSCENIPEIFSDRDIHVIADNCRNIFEEVTDIPEIKRIKEIILDHGALCSVMTGSGSAVFGIFEEINQAASAASSLRQYGYFGETAFPEKYGVSLKNYYEE